LRDAFFNGSVFLLVGSLLIGALTGEKGDAALHPFTSDIFKGMLCLFLLDMGLVSARQLDRLKQMGAFPIMFGLLIPLVNATIGITLARVLGMSEGDALMFSISAPARLHRGSGGDAPGRSRSEPGLYVSMALALTFPLTSSWECRSICM
jgi:hypothetical protein